MSAPFARTALVAAAALLAGACGANSDADANLSPAALEGRRVVRSKGCAACHGSNGGGGVGPAFVGLAGSEVPIQGEAEPVVADRAYLRRSILDPSAQRVEGYNLPMPATELTDAEVDAVIDYIEALADEGDT